MMRMLGCWPCISEVWSLLIEKLWPNPIPESKPLPEDVLANIFSRTPAECLYQCAQTYRDWSCLFSTHYFVHDLFLPRATPTIIVYSGSNNHNELYYVGDDWAGKKKRISLNGEQDFLLCGLTQLKFSSYGLLFFANKVEHYTVVLNPVTWERTLLFHPSKGVSVICGIYFHPIVKEYRVLLVSSYDNTYVDYKLFRGKGEGAPLRYWSKLSKSWYYPKIEGASPVNLHGSLHWMRCFSSPFSPPSIIVFSIVEEEFKLMPHPTGVPVCDSKGRSDNKMHIFELEGKLSLCQFSDTLGIWTLEDYSSWFWTKRHNITHELFDIIGNTTWVYVLGIQNDSLVIHVQGKGILAYNLQQNTTKKLIFDEGRDTSATVRLHTKSLVSLRGFQLCTTKLEQNLDTITKSKLKRKTTQKMHLIESNSQWTDGMQEKIRGVWRKKDAELNDSVNKVSSYSKMVIL